MKQIIEQYALGFLYILFVAFLLAGFVKILTFVSSV